VEKSFLASTKPLKTSGKRIGIRENKQSLVHQPFVFSIVVHSYTVCTPGVFHDRNGRTPTNLTQRTISVTKHNYLSHSKLDSSIVVKNSLC